MERGEGWPAGTDLPHRVVVRRIGSVWGQAAEGGEPRLATSRTLGEGQEIHVATQHPHSNKRGNRRGGGGPVKMAPKGVYSRGSQEIYKPGYLQSFPLDTALYMNLCRLVVLSQNIMGPSRAILSQKVVLQGYTK